MKKQLIIIMVIILVGVLVFAGCDNSVSVQSNEPTSEPSEQVQTQPEQPDTAEEKPSQDITPIQPQDITSAQSQESTLTVNATESVKKMPDIAYISIGVRTTGDTAEAAQQENARITTAFLNAVKAQGIEEADLETQNLNVYTDYENPQKTVMENTYRVTVRNIDKVGAVIDAAVAAGANSTYSLVFDLTDRDSVYMEALATAMKSVDKKAKTVAQAGGYTIVRPQSIQEENVGYGVPYMAEASAQDMAAGGLVTPVTPQEIEVSATVIGTYIIA